MGNVRFYSFAHLLFISVQKIYCKSTIESVRPHVDSTDLMVDLQNNDTKHISFQINQFRSLVFFLPTQGTWKMH
jgi:hypothetical protein